MHIIFVINYNVSQFYSITPVRQSWTLNQIYRIKHLPFFHIQNNGINKLTKIRNLTKISHINVTFLKSLRTYSQLATYTIY